MFTRGLHWAVSSCYILTSYFLSICFPLMLLIGPHSAVQSLFTLPCLTRSKESAHIRGRLQYSSTCSFLRRVDSRVQPPDVGPLKLLLYFFLIIFQRKELCGKFWKRSEYMCWIFLRLPHMSNQVYLFGCQEEFLQKLLLDLFNFPFVPCLLICILVSLPLPFHCGRVALSPFFD
jgi:hypothetical protein